MHTVRVTVVNRGKGGGVKRMSKGGGDASAIERGQTSASNMHVKG